MTPMISAPAKIILLGEHAVVYGQPSLAIPFSALRSHAEIIPSTGGSGLEIIAADLENQKLIVSLSSPQLEHPIVKATMLLLDFLGCAPPDAKIVLHSDIPIASGMGSGAAITTCLYRALLFVLRKSLDNDQLNKLVYEVEKIYHGTPSGVDNTVVVFEKPIYFVRGEPIEIINIKEPFTLLIGNTGVEASTKVAVSDVRRLYEADPITIGNKIADIGKLVQEGKEALEKGDVRILGQLMQDDHRLLRELTVSSNALDALVDAAITAGAIGAKLSGGGRGGNMIALVSDGNIPLVKEALYEAGAIKVYETIIGK